MPSANAPNLLSAVFNRIDFSQSPKVIVAISGGSDSTALLILLKRHFKDHRLNNQIIAVTVDHQLRPEAADEAKYVAEMCARLGVKHVIKPWIGEKPKSGLQDAARRARYSLLHEAASEFGACFVMTGHTSSDQLETLVMRARRGIERGKERGKERGMSGIAPATLYRGETWFVRPLLVVSRSELRHFLENEQVGWVDDPSNMDKKFERVRVRSDATPSSVKNDDEKAARDQREAVAELAAVLILNDNCILRLDETQALVSPHFANDGGFDIAVAAILSLIGKKAHFPTAEKLKRLTTFCNTVRNGEALTIHGCTLLMADGMLVIQREARNQLNNEFGLHVLLPSFDYKIMDAIYQRLGLPNLLRLPFN